MIGKYIEKQFKKMGFRLLARITPVASAPPTAADLERIERILVIKPDERIGNAVLVTSLLVALKGRFSRAQLTCLISARYWQLRRHLPSTEEFIAFDKRAHARNPLRLISIVRRLRAEKYDLVFDAAGDHEVSFTHLLLTALSGGRFRVGHARGNAARFYEVAVPPPECVRHASEMHLDLLRAVTPIRSTTRPLLRPRPVTDCVARLRRDHTFDLIRPLFVVHPGARGKKLWPPAGFAAVIAELQKRTEAVIVLVWGPADTDAADAVLARVGESVIPAGVLPFDDLISLFRHAAVFLSADCGPMHLAAAAGTPVVAIFQASELEKYHTLGPYDRSLDGRRRALTSQEVADTVLDVYERSRSQPRAGAEGLIPPKRSEQTP